MGKGNKLTYEANTLLFLLGIVDVFGNTRLFREYQTAFPESCKRGKKKPSHLKWHRGRGGRA